MLVIEPHHNNEGSRLHNKDKGAFARFQNHLSKINTFMLFLVSLLSFALYLSA